MIANEKAVKRLWIMSLVLTTSLVMGSFFVSFNYLDLIYLITLYTILFIKKKIFDKEENL